MSSVVLPVPDPPNQSNSPDTAKVESPSSQTGLPQWKCLTCGYTNFNDISSAVFCKDECDPNNDGSRKCIICYAVHPRDKEK